LYAELEVEAEQQGEEDATRDEALEVFRALREKYNEVMNMDMVDLTEVMKGNGN